MARWLGGSVARGGLGARAAWRMLQHFRQTAGLSRPSFIRSITD